MRVAVVGAGGIGGYYGALLQTTGNEVAFLARGAQLAAMREGGLQVESVTAPPLSLRVHATDTARDVGQVDLVLFTVKSYDTQTAAPLLPPLLGKDTAVVTLQNGVANVEVLAATIGRQHVLGGLCYIYVTVAAPGVVRHTGGPRRIIFGELDGRATARANTIRETFEATGVPVELSRQILVEMWEKYIFIAAHGGMTALTRLPIGPIRSTPETYETYLDAVDEVAAVGRAHGVPIPAGQRERVRRIAEPLEAGAYSSLYADLTTGHRMELEALLGNVVRLGARYHAPTPVCRVIYAALRPHAIAADRVTSRSISGDPARS